VASSTSAVPARRLPAWAALRVPAVRLLPALITGLAGLTVLSQICYPLTSGTVRDRLTIATVLLWCAASLTHAAVSRGGRFAAGVLVISAGVGFGSEALGVATGVPFGHYSYAATLGPRLLGVPVIVPLAWTMMAYPALLVGRRIGAPVFGGALALASWDLFLDPQMVAAGHWRFARSGLSLNAIPLSNTAGWCLVALGIMALLVRLPQRPRRALDDRVPIALFLWTYVSSVLAAAAFFHQPGAALAGGLAMGIPVLLLARSRHRQPA
jgi:carotene biosynthesis associated membrane protein